MPPVTLFKYIAARTLVSIAALFVIMASLILLIDLIENLRFTGKVEEGTLGFALILTVLRLPALSEALLPFIFLFGAIWMFSQLNKHSEIAVMRSAGISIWRLLGPAAFVATIVGLLVITIVDPLSAGFMSYAEKMKTDIRGQKSSLIRVFNDGIWLRQRDGDTSYIINAASFDDGSEALTDLTVWRFTGESVFRERIDAPEAILAGNSLELRDAKLKAIADQTQHSSPLYAIPVTLTAQDLRERVAAPETMSIWTLPRFIGIAEAAGLSTARYHMRFHDLCSTPLKLLAMVLIAAAFSFRPSRMGGGLTLFLSAVGAGFSLYILSEVSTAFGESGLVPIPLAAWAPAIIATLAALTGLLHLEDG